MKNVSGPGLCPWFWSGFGFICVLASEPSKHVQLVESSRRFHTELHPGSAETRTPDVQHVTRKKKTTAPNTVSVVKWKKETFSLLVYSESVGRSAGDALRVSGESHLLMELSWTGSVGSGLVLGASLVSEGGAGHTSWSEESG